jgi:hypothetical protein
MRSLEAGETVSSVYVMSSTLTRVACFASLLPSNVMSRIANPAPISGW